MLFAMRSQTLFILHRRLRCAGKLRAVTQNIDGLHRLAFFTSAERTVEIHGANALVECQSMPAGDPELHFRDSSPPS